MFIKSTENVLEAFEKFSAQKMRFCQSITIPFWASFLPHFFWAEKFFERLLENFSVDFTNMSKCLQGSANLVLCVSKNRDRKRENASEGVNLEELHRLESLESRSLYRLESSGTTFWIESEPSSSIYLYSPPPAPPSEFECSFVEWFTSSC